MGFVMVRSVDYVNMASAGEILNGIDFHCGRMDPEKPPDYNCWLEHCRAAESAGFRSAELQVVDSWRNALALAVEGAANVSNLKFRISCPIDRAIQSHPPEIPTALDGRLILNFSYPDDDDALDERYRLSCEFLVSCGTSRRFEIHIEGESTAAAFLAIKHADCLWRLARPAGPFRADALPIQHFGKQVGVIRCLAGSESAEDFFAEVRRFATNGVTRILLRQASGCTDWGGFFDAALAILTMNSSGS